MKVCKTNNFLKKLNHLLHKRLAVIKTRSFFNFINDEFVKRFLFQFSINFEKNEHQFKLIEIINIC